MTGRIHLRFGILLFITAFASIAACGGGGSDVIEPPPPPPPPPVLGADEVRTAEGIYRGSIEGNLLVFRGLRYAAPPIGDLRFAAPEAPAVFSGTADATLFKPNCFQPADPDPVGDEDCLYLNIWSHNDDSVRPILVFLHGGGGGGIGGDLATSDGAQLAESADINVVTLNRRMSIFGGLALDELIADSPRVTAGNYALQDILAALQWLQDNAAEFGGDPNRIMVVGESAGASLLCHILASPDAAGLMSAAIVQSAGCGRRTRLTDSVMTETPFEPIVDTHRPVVAAAGCDMAADVVQCLRDLPAADVITAGGAAIAAAGRSRIWGPIIDGVVVATDPHTALMAETAGNIPIIVGSTANEGGGGFSGPPPVDDADYRARLANIFPDPQDDQVYAIYPTANFASVEEAWVTFWGEWIFNCLAEELARSASGNAPAYLYQFSRGFSTGSRAGLGAVHAIDVPFLFETYDVFGHTPDADDEAVTDAMQNAWSGLAADPNSPPPYLPTGSSAWPAYDPTNVQYVDFNAPVTVPTVHRAGRCEQLRTVISF